MTKLEMGIRYETKKLLKHLALFIAGVVVFLGAIQVIFLLAGAGLVDFGGSYSFAFFFLIFWTAIVFGKDAGLFLQSGFTRRELFVVFVLAVVVETLVLALLDAVLSLLAPGFWLDQSLFLRMAGSYTAVLFIRVFLLNLAVASCTLVVTMLRLRVGTGWTVAFLVGLYLLVAVGLPYLFGLIPGGIEAYSMFMVALVGSSHASAISLAFYLAIALISAALTWVLLRRANAECFSAGR